MSLSRADNVMLRRFADAAILLHIHGLMSNSERRQCYTRMLKWKARKEVRSGPKRKGK